jgi:hypothetical protein
MLSQLGSIDSVDSADGDPCCGRTYRSNRKNLNKRGYRNAGRNYLALDSKSLGIYVVKKEAGGPTTIVPCLRPTIGVDFSHSREL